MAKFQSEAYLLGRDVEESARLNSQQDFLLEVSGHNVIHPSIPINSIRSIADIATGTGIWLRGAASVLNIQNSQPRTPYYLHGFDISSAQFQPLPEQSNAEIHLSVQNCLEPFPPEHHGRYDFVHVRLLICALKTEEYEHALKNIFQILKPGGYFQWEENNTGCFDFDVTPWPPSVLEANRVILGAMRESGLCIIPAGHIKNEAQRVGFGDLYIEEYNSGSKPHLRDWSRTWAIQLMKSLFSTSVVQIGEESDETIVKERSEKLIAEVERECAGIASLMKLCSITGRKPNGVGSAM